jgi:hypothetical protein
VNRLETSRLETATANRTRIITSPKRTTAVAIGSVLGLVALGALGWVGLNILRNSKEGKSSAEVAQQVVVLPDTRAYLVAAIDRAAKPAALFLLAPKPSGGGSIIIVPTRARVDTRDPTKPTRPEDMYDKANLSPFTDAVGSWLGVQFEEVFTLDASALSTFLNPLGPVTFAIDKGVVDTDLNNTDKVLFPAGATTLATAADASRYVLARSLNDPEQPRLARLDQFWKAAVAPNPARPPADATATGAVAIMNTMLKGTVSVFTLTGTAVTDIKLNPNKSDMVGVDNATLHQLMAEVLPGAVSPSNNGLRIELRDPFDDARVRKELIGRLTFLKANIIWSHAIDRGPVLETVLDYVNPSKKAAVDFYAKVLGNKVLSGESAESVDNVDLVVTIGQDLHDEIVKSLPAIAPAPGATTVVGVSSTTSA